tara:strand:+ start:14236 stop:14721 length:486 start_codon:yes stop_codon:yes gene_type:complete
MLSNLYDRVAEPAYSLAARILGQSEAAQEVVTLVFEEIRNDAEDAQANIDLLGNTVLSLVRQRALTRRHTETDSHVPGSKNESHLAVIPEPAGGYRQPLMSRQDQALFLEALSQLAPEERHAIDLVFFEGLTQDELKDRFDMTSDRIRLNVEHALQKLQDA